MCGIIAIINKNKVTEKTVIKRMADSISHRGPDAEGFFQYKNVNLAHLRLSIIDLSDSGKQPMHYQNRYTITFNGEVYNYIELKEELIKKGYLFSTQTDTEVIMAAYDCWGENCLTRFNGMWAFVLIDRHKDEIFISRDRFGKKPLYYYQDNSVLIFASEIKAILEYPEISTSQNNSYCSDYINNGQKEYIKETAFTNIYRFLHAHCLKENIHSFFGKSITEKRYWQIEVNTTMSKFSETNMQEYTNHFFQLLKDAVNLRLRADVKVGSALSGGIDSSSIVALINLCLEEQNSNKKIQETFSSIFQTAGAEYCDESYFIKELSEYLNVKSNTVEPIEKNVPEIYNKIAYHMDVPYDGTLMSAWHVYELVKERGVTVTLDGQGQDEQMAGYVSYLKHYLSQNKQPIKEVINAVKRKHNKNLILKGFLFNSLLQSMPFGKHIFKYFGGNPIFLSNLNLRLSDDVTKYITKHFLYGDKLSMAHQVESRNPFMDYRLVEFTAQIPFNYKIYKGWTKYIPRKAMQDFLPENILWRTDKKGFPNPEKYWFDGGLKKWINGKILKSAFLNYLVENKYIASYSNDFDISTRVRYLNLAVWNNIFFENDY